MPDPQLPKRPHAGDEQEEDAGDDIPDLGGRAQPSKPPSTPIVESDD